MSRKNWHRFLTVVINLFRVIVAFVFLFSGFVKATDPIGTAIKLQEYCTSFGMDFLSQDNSLLVILALAQAVVEFILGVYLLLGIYRRGSTVTLLVLMAVLTPFTLYVAITNPVSDCGCFGDAVHLTNWQTFAKNVVLLFMVIMVVCCRKRIIPFVTSLTDGLISAVTLFLIITYSAYNVYHLPLLDFRPYKEGVNLQEKVLLEADADFLNFWVSDSEGNDCTQDLLEHQGYSFVLISDFLEDFDYTNYDRVTDLIEYTRSYGYRFVILTSSESAVVEQWRQEMDPSVEFMSADDAVLKTIIRSNPGLVILKDGRIMSKFSRSDIPKDDVLIASVDSLDILNADKILALPTWAFVLFYMLVPFMVIGLINVGIVVFRRYKVKNK
ncbi:MAG: DoxX family membrane protein [Bacteroidaceae bacterium]|nr:DoxX family membrane protein [Bacteroidaceae bacterium]